jgi:hypothetical protein
LVFQDALLRIITDFYRRDEIKKLAADQGLDIRLFQDAYVSFRKFCIQSTVLPVDLHIVLSDIISESGTIFYFLSFGNLILFLKRSCYRYISLFFTSCKRNVSTFNMYGGFKKDQ